MLFKITDDSGFLALIDPDAYDGFVGSDWSVGLRVLFGIHQTALARATSGASGQAVVSFPVEQMTKRGPVSKIKFTPDEVIEGFFGIRVRGCGKVCLRFSIAAAAKKLNASLTKR